MATWGVVVHHSDFVGLVGTAVYLLAYGLAQTGRLAYENPRYSLLNMIASALVVYSLYWSFNLASLVTNFAWFIFSVFGLVRLLRTRRAS